MKLLLLTFAVLLLTSQARFTNETKTTNGSNIEKRDVLFPMADPSTIENKAIVELSALYKELLRFGIKEVAKKYQASNGARFTPNPYNKVTFVRTANSAGLTVTFDVDMIDNKGRLRKVTLTVNYQAWRKHMGLVNYSVKN